MLLGVLDEAFDRHAWHGVNLRGSVRGGARRLSRRPDPGSEALASEPPPIPLSSALDWKGSSSKERRHGIDTVDRARAGNRGSGFPSARRQDGTGRLARRGGGGEGPA